MSVRIAVQLKPQHADYSAIERAVREADAKGVDVIYNWDHFFPLYGGELYGGESDATVGKHYECWTMLGAWAEQTERIQFGALVTCNSYRNPNLLADMARTVDAMSGGRLIFGIGSGWFEKDYDEYGYDFGTPGSRLADLRQALPRITDRWSKLNPAPIRDIPILIGGGGEKKTLRYTAEYAHIWHGFGDADVIRHKNQILDNHCVDIGRDPGEIERSAGATPAKPETADDLYDAGATFITLGFDGDTKYDLAPVAEWLAWRDEKNAG